MKLFYKEKIDNKRILHILGLKITYKKKNIDSIIEKNVQNYMNVFLNSFFEPQDIKPKNGKLKILNSGNTELIRIVHNICKKYNLKYWLNYGTLLGAIRHQGAIPWDYDADIAMLREDFNKFFEIVEEELKDTEVKIYGISEILPYTGMGIILSNKTGEKFLNLDICPMDNLLINEESNNSFIEELKENAKDYYLKLFPKEKHIISKDEIKQYHTQINSFIDNLKSNAFIKELSGGGKNYILRLIPNNYFYWDAFNYEDIFPLKEVPYENYKFFVPNNYEQVLKIYYGENWNSFPSNFNIKALRWWTDKISLPLGKEILHKLEKL